MILYAKNTSARRNGPNFVRAAETPRGRYVLCDFVSCSMRFFFNLTALTIYCILQGSYTLKMKMFDGNKHELTCITFGFDIGFGSSVADS